MSHLRRAQQLISPRGETVDMVTWPTEQDIETAKACALISIAESLAELVSRDELNQRPR